MRLKDQRRPAALHDSIVQLAVDNDLHGSAAAGTGRVDLYHEVALPQLPLHEGRRYRVFRSGRVYSLSRAKDQMVSGIFSRHRKGPGDVSARANEEEQVPLQIFDNGRGACSGDPERVRYGTQRDRLSHSWELLHNEIPYQVMFI